MKILTKPTFTEELFYWQNNINHVIGLDEVGRGAFAGPIVAGGVVFSSRVDPQILYEVNDSKLLKPNKRTECAKIIKKHALFWTVEEIGIDYINKYGIGKANSAVFRKVLSNLITAIGSNDYFVLLDGFHQRYLPGGIKKQKGVIKGDQKCLSIAAASVIAKVHRDSLMQKAERLYPNYGFAKNKGYGTKFHRDAIALIGPSSFHRVDFIN